MWWKRPEKDDFTLNDFRAQLAHVFRPGILQKMMYLLPGMGKLRRLTREHADDKELKRIFGIIDAMTLQERCDPALVNLSRRRRIARGAGVAPKHVTELIKQFLRMATMMKLMKKSQE